MKHRLVLVTDPMCSWCWGMTTEFELARQQLADRVDFELMLGGINTHGTQPIGDYGRRFLMRLWKEVEATTGQPFGYRLPDTYIHNSSRTCLAIEAARELMDGEPFDYLHVLQKKFFIDGLDITQPGLLLETATDLGLDAQVLEQRMADEGVLARLRFQFDAALTFGTQAMPSLLREAEEGKLVLLAGGFVDADMLQQLVDGLPA